MLFKSGLVAPKRKLWETVSFVQNIFVNYQVILLWILINEQFNWRNSEMIKSGIVFLFILFDETEK